MKLPYIKIDEMEGINSSILTLIRYAKSNGLELDDFVDCLGMSLKVCYGITTFSQGSDCNRLLSGVYTDVLGFRSMLNKWLIQDTKERIKQRLGDSCSSETLDRYFQNIVSPEVVLMERNSLYMEGYAINYQRMREVKK